VAARARFAQGRSHFAVSDSLYALAAGTVGGLIRRKRRLVSYGSGIVYVTLGAAAAFAKRA
jgi:hypothetical protein